MRLCLDCDVVFMVDYNDLSSIRSFSRYLLGFLRVESGKEWFGVSFMVFLGWDGLGFLC